MEYIEILMSIGDCNYSNNDYVLAHHPEVECFSLLHTVHLIAAILGLLFFASLTYLVVSLFYEPIKDSNHPLAILYPYPFIINLAIITIIQTIMFIFQDVYHIYIYI